MNIGREQDENKEQEYWRALCPSEDEEFLGEAPLVIAGTTLWYGRGHFDEPYFQVHMSVDVPAWYPTLTYRVSESFDGDGWVVQCMHNSCPRPLVVKGHPFFSGVPLTAMLAGIAVLARERVNLFQELDRPWHEPVEIDLERLERLERLRVEVLPFVETALRQMKGHSLTDDPFL